MHYTLYSGVDTRDNKPALWLCEAGGAWRVAMFDHKTSPSRIKRRTAAAPEGITWGPRHVLAAFCQNPDVVARWEMPG